MKEPSNDQRPRILLVDDEPTNLHVLRQILQADYTLLFATNGERALELAQSLPDLILLDIMMPQMNGYSVCQALKRDQRTHDIPVIFITTLSEEEDEAQGFDAGAVDYIIKPVRAPIVRARVRTHLSLVRMEELRETRLEIVRRLGRAAEYKDNETGKHVIRMSRFSQILGLHSGCNELWCEVLLNAAPMHDIGKIGIPDSVLLKPGALDAQEWDTMRTHTVIGAEIIGQHSSNLLQMAQTIALTHHEKWDGSGYPAGLKGEEIPLASRIVALCDVFDALTSVRPYKKAWSTEEAVAHIQAQSGKHFEPRLVTLFLEVLPQLEKVRQQWAE